MEISSDVGFVLSSFLDPLSLEQLLQVQDLLNKKIDGARSAMRTKASTVNISDYVEHAEAYVGHDDPLFADIFSEATSLGLDSGTKSAPKTSWLTLDGEAYVWENKSGKKFVNPPTDFQLYPSLMKLMSKINSDYNLQLNSCLLTYYRDGRSGIKLHQDSEDSMDPASPICVLTLGGSRRVEFLSILQNPNETPLLSFSPAEGDLYLMKAGCQSLLKHRVPAEAGALPRYSLSFRRKISTDGEKKIITPSPLKGRIPSFSQEKSSKSPIPRGPAPAFVSGVNAKFPRTYPPFSSSKTTSPNVLRGASRHSTVLFGTSITADIIPDPRKGFFNASRSGAFLRHIPEMMKDFHAFDSERAASICKVIFSVGTNDIKHDSSGRGMMKHRHALINLIKMAQSMFPGCRVWFQAALPMQRKYSYTSVNVKDFNNLLADVCRSYGCNFIDCCRRFVAAEGGDFNKYLFRDWLHLNYWGMNVLCKIISGVIDFVS